MSQLSSNSNDLIVKKTQTHLYGKALKQRCPGEGIQRTALKKSWSPLEHIPENAASSSEGSTKPIMQPLDVQMSELEDR